jgi:hypothetical protein
MRRDLALVGKLPHAATTQRQKLGRLLSVQEGLGRSRLSVAAMRPPVLSDSVSALPTKKS